MPLGAELASVLRALSSTRRTHVWLWLRDREHPVAIAEAARELGIPPRHLQRDLSPLVDAGLARWAPGARVAVGPLSLTELADRAEALQPLGGVVADHPRLETVIRTGIVERVPPDAELREELLDLVSAALPAFDVLDEPQLNALLEEMTSDVPLLRRWLVDTGRLTRSADGSEYRRG